jgi:hypothetical protein
VGLLILLQLHPMSFHPWNGTAYNQTVVNETALADLALLLNMAKTSGLALTVIGRYHFTVPSPAGLLTGHASRSIELSC